MFWCVCPFQFRQLSVDGHFDRILAWDIELLDSVVFLIYKTGTIMAESIIHLGS